MHSPEIGYNPCFAKPIIAKARVLLPEPDSPTIPTVSPLLIDVEIFFSIDISLPSWLLKPIDRLLIFCIISFILYWCFLGTINSKSFS